MLRHNRITQRGVCRHRLAVWLVTAGMLGVAAHAAFAVDHPADGPQVKHVGAVAPDVLMITIQSGFYQPSEYVPYTAEPGASAAASNSRRRTLSGTGRATSARRMARSFTKARSVAMTDRKVRAAKTW